MSESATSTHRFGPDDPNPWMHPMEAIQWLWHVGKVPTGELDECESLLDEALQCGDIGASGIHKGKEDRELVPLIFWQDHRTEIHPDAGTRFVERDPGDRNKVELLRNGSWRKIMYLRADVLRLWPPVAVVAVASAEAHRNGKPGRPNSMRYVRQEISERIARGETWVSKKACAEAMVQWLEKTHPNVTLISADTIRVEIPSEAIRAQN